MRRIIYILITIVVITCSVIYYLSIPDIPIYDMDQHLKINHDYQGYKNYYHYVRLLNRSVHKDTAALRSFLEINEIMDGATYDHGWVLTQLINKDGDEVFSEVVKTIDSTQIEILKDYIEAGMDNEDKKSNDSLILQHPKTFNALRYTADDIDGDVMAH